MTHEQFVQAVFKTRELLEKAAGSVRVPAERNTDLASSPGHLAWMLNSCTYFHQEGKVEKANRWLGFVQGSMHADGYATLEELKRANMPEGDTFDPEKV